MYSQQVIFPKLICFIMLKYYLSLYLLLYLINAFSQSTIIASYGFENTENNWSDPIFSTPPCTTEGDTWNFHTTLGNISPSEGVYFWGIQDLNGNCGSSGFETIELPFIDISGFRNVHLSFDVQVLGYDNGDDMKYQVWFDGEAQQEVLFIDGANDLSTNGWMEIKISIPNNTSRVKLMISVKQNGSDIAGIDHIRLQGDALVSCSELMISEYLEGRSSSNTRNNYIELYNPTDSPVDLGAYELNKYTGPAAEVSSSLSLSGIIPAHGTYLIEDDQEVLDIQADLSTNSAVMNFNGDDKIALVHDKNIIDIIGVIGDSLDFAKDLTLRRKSHVQNANNQYDPGEWDIFKLEDTGNLNRHVSSCEGEIPEIHLEAEGYPLIDGSEATTMLNNTYFGSVSFKSDSSLTRSYTIKNLGDRDLDIISITFSGQNANEFKTAFQGPVSISPDDSLSFSIIYKPIDPGLSTARVEITNSDASENPFDFTIHAESTGPTTDPLMITQYYEGSGNNKWVEITNVGTETSLENSYYLALFWNDDTKSPIGIKPSRKKLIPPLAPGETITFSATLNVYSPAYALNGKEIRSTVCSFTGDDILVISTTGDTSCWENRTDIIGLSGNWGADKSMLRKYGCLATGPNTGFDPGDWLVHSYEEVNLAASGTNLRLGEFFAGPANFFMGSWQNGLPDLYRAAQITTDYSTAVDGNFTACELLVASGANLKIAAGNHVSIQNNLNVKGALEILHEGSLIMINDSGRVDNQGSIKVHKKTTDIQPYDYTFWSSPVKSSRLEEVFHDSPKNSFYTFATERFEDLDQNGTDDNNDAWVRASGVMDIARGYTSMAPGAPFSGQQEVIFTGEVNNGFLEIPIAMQSADTYPLTDWNLIGNPYPSAIDAEALLTDPRNASLLTSTLYFWTHNTPAEATGEGSGVYSSDDYAMYTLGTGGIKANSEGVRPTKFIASGQGFFVEARREGKLFFKNAFRSPTGNDNFYKIKPSKINKEADRIWLNLSNRHGIFSQILLGFIKGASHDFDPHFDGLRLSANRSASLYTCLDDLRLAIQGMPDFKGDEVIPLGIDNHIEEPVSLKIEIDHVLGKLRQRNVYLYDKQLQVMHNLKNQAYSFHLKGAGAYKDRFELRFLKGMPDPLPDPDPVSRIIWFTENNYLYIRTNNNEQISNLKIYDFNGRIIKNMDLSDALVQLKWEGLPSRVIFLLRVKLENSKILTARILP
jgi:hypothetical protein